jgi:lambda family phage portal protein
MADDFDAAHEDAGAALASAWPRAMLEASFRDATTSGNGEISLWRPALASADHAILKDARILRARARDLVRNNPLAKNAVRMQRDSVSGSGLKLSLKIDWRTLGMDIEAASEWQDHATRMWEAYAEGSDFAADARRQLTFSQLFMLCDTTDFVDGEALAVIEMKPSALGYQTCLSLIDVDRLTTPDGRIDSQILRAGVERDVFGEPIAYHIRESHPHDVTVSLNGWTWKRVPRATVWGRPIVMHSYDHARPEMTRGVSEFASAIAPMKMLQQYADTELHSAIAQAAVAAVIKTELDWTSAMTVLGGKDKGFATGNPLSDLAGAQMAQAAEYAKKREITFQGVEIPHLLPNESIDVIRPTHPNSNFSDFESAFVRHLAAGLGVEAHELGKNYREVNYSSARAALLAVWRTYLTRRHRLVNQIAMPFFGAWLEEAIWLGTVPLPPGITDFQAAKPFLVRGTFVAWGKPMIDPMKERQAQQLSVQMGAETLEEIAANDGKNWRDLVDQNAYERAYYRKLGLPHPSDLVPVPMMAPPDAETKTTGADADA